MDAELPTLSVCIVTYERSAFLERCLAGVGEELADIEQVVVVDASASSDEAHARAALPSVVYDHRPDLAGWMTRSRNAALGHVTGDVVVFIDDDVVVRPGWARALRAAFAETGAAAVVGRTCNNLPGEESYDQPIGRLLDDGTLTEGFASIVSTRVEVDHGIGANMAFRRDVVDRLGGFRDDYPGTALREDTDMFLRVGRLGGRILYDPDAAVDHRPAPHARGERFDTRYRLYARRNHVVLLGRNVGVASPVMRRWLARDVASVAEVHGWKRKAQRLGVSAVGLVWGLGALPRSGARLRAIDPVRTPRIRTGEARVSGS